MTGGAGALASLIRPLGAYLPRPDLAGQIVAPQYDNLTIEEVHRLGADNPLSFLNVVRSEIDHPEHTPDERRAMLDETAIRLRRLLDGETFDHYEPPVFFVCRLELFGHAQSGIVADVALEAYEKGLVRIHESTRRGQEDRLVEYMDAVRASFLPAFLIHRKTDSIDDVVARMSSRDPLIEVQADSNLKITFWLVSEPRDVAVVEQSLAELDALYIADGHHRAAAAARFAKARRGRSSPGLEPFEHLTSVIFSSDQLVVHPYNRCVTDLSVAPADLLRQIAEAFPTVELADGDDPAPDGTGILSMYLDGRWYRITVPESIRAVPGVAGLDVSVLHDRILGPLLGVSDARNDPRIDFVPGTMGLDELERMCVTGRAVAFAVPAMDVEDLLDAADRGEIMPPKSTWFAPKLRSGLVVRLL